MNRTVLQGLDLQSKKVRPKTMLALTRKINETIVIGNDIEITVLDIKGDQVKLGISAPKSVPIYRKEIYVQIQEENREAVTNAGDSIEVLKGLKRK